MRRASELKECRLIQTGYKASWNIEWNRYLGTKITGIEPDEEDLRSFLLTFRQFISSNEPIFINRVYGILYARVTSVDIRDDMIESRQVFKEEKSASFLELVSDSNRMDSSYILDIWINGYYFHNDQVKSSIISSLQPHEVIVLRHALHNVIQRTVEEVLYIASIIEIVLIDKLIVAE